MAEKILLTCDEMKDNLVVPETAMDCYRFALANAGIEMDEDAEADFVTKRNARSGWRDLKEAAAWFKKAYESIDEVLKHSFNIGTEDELPPNVKWSKQSYSYEFNGDVGVTIARQLSKKNLVSIDQLLAIITPSQIAKASGLTVDKIADMYPDTIAAKPKARTLTIK